MKYIVLFSLISFIGFSQNTLEIRIYSSIGSQSLKSDSVHLSIKKSNLLVQKSVNFNSEIGGCFVEEYKKNRNRIFRRFTNCEGFRLLSDSTSILFQENGVVSYDDINIAMVLDKWRGDSFYSEGYEVIAPNESRLTNADLYYTVLEDTVYFFDSIHRINYVYINSPNEKLYINLLTSDTVKFGLEKDRLFEIYENNKRVSIIDYNSSGLIRSFTGFGDKIDYRYSRSRLRESKIKRINEQLVFKELRHNYPEFVSIFLAVNILNSNRYYDNLIFTGY